MLFTATEKTGGEADLNGRGGSKVPCLGLVKSEMSMSNSSGNTEEAIQCGA